MDKQREITTFDNFYSSNTFGDLQREYFKEIEELCKSAFEDYDTKDPEEARENLHEIIDGHQWIIYTGKNALVLLVSDNADYGIDEGLIDSNTQNKEAALAF